LELSFVISALRRRFWIVTLFALLGSIPGLRADPVLSTNYESTAVLLVQPPTRTTVNVFSADPDRYVVSQLSVLESESLASDVAARITAEFGEEITVSALRTLVEIEHVPQTDIVEVTTTIDNAQKAAAISQAYVELYVEGLATSDEDAEQRIDLEQRIQTLQNRLDSLDQRLQDAMREHLPRRGDQTPDPIPPAEVIDPSAVSQRQLVQVELQQLKGQLNDLDIQSRLRVNTEIISNAPQPLEPIPPSGNFLLAGGLVAGLMLGVVVALLWARFSAKVLDDVTAGEILGAPIVSDIPHYRSLSRNPLAAFQALPRSAIPTIDQLCVRAEALARIGEPLVVVVTGTMRSAGSTTLSLAMAERFAAGGASVVVVDADVRDPRITSLFNASSDGGVPAVISNDGALVDARGRSAFTRTMDPAVSVLGLGAHRGTAALRRDTVPAVLDAARRKAEVVVIDGGPVLDLASTLHLTALADAVVLAVPLARQKADPLSDLSRQLEAVRPKLLPVITSPSRRPARGDAVRSDGAIAVPGSTSAGYGDPNGSVPTAAQVPVVTGVSAAHPQRAQPAQQPQHAGTATATAPSTVASVPRAARTNQSVLGETPGAATVPPPQVRQPD
jgi:Mrp family chromosome partitioning ATPase/capsular polysaccharide biosynthesis protein